MFIIKSEKGLADNEIKEVIDYCYADINAINIVLFDGELSSAAYFPPLPPFYEKLLVQLPQFITGIGETLTNSTISHEIGHVFSARHTHFSTEFYNNDPCSNGGAPGDCFELVTVASDECGDLVADTPADPCLHFEVNIDCDTWTRAGLYQDENGDSYVPALTNIMSYTIPSCMRELLRINMI